MGPLSSLDDPVGLSEVFNTHDTAAHSCTIAPQRLEKRVTEGCGISGLSPFVSTRTKAYSFVPTPIVILIQSVLRSV